MIVNLNYADLRLLFDSLDSIVDGLFVMPNDSYLPVPAVTTNLPNAANSIPEVPLTVTP